MSIKLLVQKKCHHSAFDTRGLPWKPSMGQSHVVVSDVQGRTGTSPCNNTFLSTFRTTVPRATFGKGVGEGYSTLPRDDFTSYMLLGLLSRFRLPVKPRSNDFKEQGEEGLSQGAVTRTRRPQGERPSLVQGGLSHMYWFCFFVFKQDQCVSITQQKGADCSAWRHKKDSPGPQTPGQTRGDTGHRHPDRLEPTLQTEGHSNWRF